MRSLVVVVSFFLISCTSSHFSVSTQRYQQEVRTLGVLPVLLDQSADFSYTDHAGLFALLQEASRGQSDGLAALLRGEEVYFDVRAVPADPAAVSATLLRGHEDVPREEGAFRRYRLDPEQVGLYAQQSVVDALLVIVLYGDSRPEKRWDRCPVPTRYLSADFSGVSAYAAVVSREGELLWEFPVTREWFLSLQYPDFDQSYYNRTDEVTLRYISVEGLRRVLEAPKRSLLGKEQGRERYLWLFELVRDALRFKGEKSANARAASISGSETGCRFAGGPK